MQLHTPQSPSIWPMELWQRVIAPLAVVAVVGVVSYLWGRANTPDTPSVRAVLSWVDVANPNLPIDAKLGDLDTRLKDLLGISGLPQFLASRRFTGNLRIGALKLSNDSNVRSRALEVDVEGSAMFSKDAAEASNSIVSKMKIKPIDPQKDAIVYFASGTWSPFLTFPVRVLHDDRVVEVIEGHTSNEAFQIFNRYPIVSTVLLVYCAISGLLISVALFYGAIADFSVRFRASQTSARETKRMVETLEYIKIHYPEKMPKTLEVESGKA